MRKATVPELLKVLNDLYSSIKETYEIDKKLVANWTLLALEKLDIGQDDLLIDGCSDLVSDANEYREEHKLWWVKR
jgi:hypothetical protein